MKDDSHVDVYGWRGNPRKEPATGPPSSIPDPVEDETRNHRGDHRDDRYRYSDSYGSRNSPPSSHDTFVKDSRHDLDAASSEKSRTPTSS